MAFNETISGGVLASAPSREDDRRRETGFSGRAFPDRLADSSDLGTDAAPPVGKSARRGNIPKIPLGDIWLDCDVAAYLHVSPRTVKRIVNEGPRAGELDLRRALPVFVGDRRWFAENVKALVKAGGRE